MGRALRFTGNRYPARIEAVGVLPGWRCLKIAAPGYDSRMLAERVGSSGSVVAMDIDRTENLKAPNVEVRKHDILTDPFDGP